jgi:cytochrome b6-f complex iron-sulfur subunit
MTQNVRRDLIADLPVTGRQSPGAELHRLSRRGFIGSAALSGIVAVLGGCGGESSTGPGASTGGSGATFANNILTIPLSGYSGLAATNGSALFATSINGVSPNVIVINIGGDVFRAFTSVCTHEQCTVGSFDGSRISCPCHGSQFDTTGRNVAGPAPTPLRSYTASYDAAARVVTVTKG